MHPISKIIRNLHQLPNSLAKQYVIEMIHIVVRMIDDTQVVSAFMASSIMALILSFSLLVDRCKWHFWEDKPSEKASIHRHLYLRLIYIIEKLLHALSDQQLVAGFALLATLNKKACDISAYHFNLACTLLLLSAVTHLNPLVTIHDYVYKGKTIAFSRIAAIAVQYGMSVTALSARNSKSFPSKASSLAIMPAACFENMNASNNLGLDDFFNTAANLSSTVSNVTSAMTSNGTFNASDTWHDIQAAVAPSQGFWEYITLVVFLGFAAVFLSAEWWHTRTHPTTLKHKPFGWAGVFLSVLSILVSSIIVGVVMNHFYGLRAEMEVDHWFQLKAAALQPPGYSDFVTILLVASGSLPAIQAIFGKFSFC